MNIWSTKRGWDHTRGGIIRDYEEDPIVCSGSFVQSGSPVVYTHVFGSIGHDEDVWHQFVSCEERGGSLFVKTKCGEEVRCVGRYGSIRFGNIGDDSYTIKCERCENDST